MVYLNMERRIAKDFDEAYKMTDSHDDKYACVQWKGTDVCMDIACDCGESFHVDGMFAYSVKCPDCGNVYFLNPNIELIKLENEPDGTTHCEPLSGF